VEKYPGLAAKISQEINKIPTSRKFFFPYLACVSANYGIFKIFFVKFLSAILRSERALNKQSPLLIFLIHLYKKNLAAIILSQPA
jgi:hypothetical protein